MTKMLSLTLDEAREVGRSGVEITPQRLEQAKENLLSLDVVGVQERFEDLCDALNQEFGWGLGREPAWANPSEPVAVSNALRERIAEDNAADIELYQLAQRVVDERRRRPATK